MKKVTKTNAARILDQMGIAYEIKTYQVDEEHLGAGDVAEKCGVPLENSVKTLVLRGESSGVIVACVLGSGEIHLKKLAAISKNKKVEMVPLKDIYHLTGYVRGGVSPVGMKKQYPLYIERSIMEKKKIIISAGQRGYQLYLNPQELFQTMEHEVGSFMI